MNRNPVTRLHLAFVATLVAALSSPATGGSGCSPDDGHGHGAKPAAAGQDLMTRRCEHEILHYTCDACRYELGVVRLAPDMLKEKGGIVGLAKAEVRPLPATRDFTGELQAAEDAVVHVSPRLAGVVSGAPAGLGAVVKQGDPLFEIRSRELGEAVGLFRRNWTAANLARTRAEREQRLFAEKAGAEIDALEARAAAEQAEADLAASRHALLALGLSAATLDALRAGAGGPAAEGILLHASPLSGTVIERHLAVGERVSGDKEVLVVADLSRVSAWIDVRENDLAAVEAALAKGVVRAAVSLAAYPGEEFPGVVERLNAVMDESARVVRARAVLDNPSGRLRPGMFCAARLALGEDRKVMTVPRDAVLRDEGRAFVFRRLEGDYFLRVDVRAGLDSGGFVEVAEGLSGGETVIAEGAFLLKSDVLREKMGAGCAD